MKIQHLSVVFIIIILPISMVISYYLNAQIKTISLQEMYDSKLVTATYDSVRSFQLNTLNNKFATVSDSKIRDIEAGISSFYNSLGTELGGTGYDTNDLKNFIPAILYSMYDGYYLYGKYYDPGIKNTDGSYGDYRIGLKPYVFYSCRYKNDNYDIVVNYTLDNYISIYGKKGSNTFAKSGYLVFIGNDSKPGYVQVINETSYNYLTTQGIRVDNTICKGVKYRNVDITPEILTERLIVLDEYDHAESDIYEYINYNGQKIYLDKDEDGNPITDNGQIYYYQDDYGNIQQYTGIKCFLYQNNKKSLVTDRERMAFINEMFYDGHLHSNSACQYYYEANKFSTEVYDLLKDISQNDAMDENDNQIKDFDTITNSDKIFDLKNEDPELEISVFNQNRIDVIQRTIKTGLVAEMANFGANTGYEYRMPQLSVDDWDKVVNNTCVTTFMQGMPIGMKFYNNYCVVPNDKNKEVVNEDSIYVLVKDDEGQVQVHYPGCKESITSNKIVGAYRNIDFERQSIVKNDVDAYYYYPHDDPKSYECMVNAKGTYDIEDIITGTLHKIQEEKKVIDTDYNTGFDNSMLRKVYLTALAREKYDLYKTNGSLK